MNDIYTLKARKICDETVCRSGKELLCISGEAMGGIRLHFLSYHRGWLATLDIHACHISLIPHYEVHLIIIVLNVVPHFELKWSSIGEDHRTRDNSTDNTVDAKREGILLL